MKPSLESVKAAYAVDFAAKGDDALIEAMARAMFKDEQINRLDIAEAALAVCRPIIEAPLRAEKEKLRAALKRLHEAATEATEDLIFGEWWKEELDAAAAALKEME